MVAKTHSMNKPKKGQSKKKEEIKIEDHTEYIKKAFSSSKGKKLDIRHLWDCYYRLNFWGRKKDIKGPVIVDSKFIKVYLYRKKLIHKVF
jgi:hypothetical protein